MGSVLLRCLPVSNKEEASQTTICISQKFKFSCTKPPESPGTEPVRKFFGIEDVGTHRSPPPAVSSVTALIPSRSTEEKFHSRHILSGLIADTLITRQGMVSLVTNTRSILATQNVYRLPSDSETTRCSAVRLIFSTGAALWIQRANSLICNRDVVKVMSSNLPKTLVAPGDHVLRLNGLYSCMCHRFEFCTTVFTPTKITVAV